MEPEPEEGWKAPRGRALRGFKAGARARDPAGRSGGESRRVGKSRVGLPWVGAWGSLSLTCMPGAAARQLRALRSARS